MERLKSITIIFLLAVGLLSSVAPAKTTSVLLQEGLYAEEIEGDLDAAIKIYEQVIAESEKVQRAAAQATYRIGICFLKKGEKAKAAEQFRNLISKYPEQQTLGTRAREQLEKLGPAILDDFDSTELVPVDQLIKSGKVPAFKTQIYDNTGLDLETGASVPFMDEWPALCDVAWDNDGGGALMIKASSSVRFLALGTAEKWEDAISMARHSLGVLKTSTSKGMFASVSKFAAVLTSEGNLAVIQIGEYDAEQATVYGWIEKIPAEAHGFGPVIEQVILSEEHGANFFFDLDTAKAFSPPPGLTRSSPPIEIIKWGRTKGIDFVNDKGRFELAEMIAFEVPGEMWYSAGPAEIRNALRKASSLKSLPTQSKDHTPSSPITYAFKTREGGIGILQILDKKNNNLRIRYKMLQGETAEFSVSIHKVFLPECDTTVYDLLDLASNKIINSEPGGKLIDLRDPAGKGNLYFDRSRGSDYLVCVRGTRMQLRSRGELLLSEPNFISHGRNAYYPLVEIPCQYLVTTAQGDKYELKVLSVMTSEKPSIEIEYWKSSESPGTFAVVTPVRGEAATNARSVAEAFLAAAISGRDSEAIKLVKPGSAVVRQVKDFRQILDPEKLKIVSILADEAIAVVTTTEISAAVTTTETRVEDKGPLLIRLIKQRGIWMVEDVDLENPASLKAELDSFLKKHPNATKLQKDPFRDKMLQKKSAGRIVFLPDADDVIQQGKVAVVLDLTTGKMLPGNKDKQYFNKLNKGDIAYFDDEGKDLLVCFRGAKITRKTADEKYSDTPDQSHTDNTIHLYIINKTPAEWTITTKEGDIYELKVLSLDNNQAKIKYRKMPTDGKVWTIKPDLSSPEATIKSFVKAVYDGNLEAAGTCVSKDGADYDEFKDMLATESNHPFQAMIKAMDVSIPVEITSKSIKDGKCKLSWYFTLGRVYYFLETKMEKGTLQEFSSYLELVGDKWLIRDI
jgi:hypothetical protein